MKILVTGAAGFIGSSLIDRLLENGHRVLGLDNFNHFYDPEIKESNIRQALLHDSFELMRGDIRDVSFVENAFAQFRPDRLVHLAAWAGVRPSIEDPGRYSDVNLTGSVNLFQACVRHGVERVCFASSSSVYGDRQSVPFREFDDVAQPISPYAATKEPANYSPTRGTICTSFISIACDFLPSMDPGRDLKWQSPSLWTQSKMVAR